MIPTRALDVGLAWSAAGGAWLATYWLHAALLFGLAWAVDRMALQGRPRAADLLWKLAILGALVTATVRAASPAGATVGIEPPRREVRLTRTIRLAGRPGETPRPPVDRATTRSTLHPGAAGWLAAGFWIWMAGAVVGVARWCSGARRLRRALSLRRPLADPASIAALDDLLAQAPALRGVHCSVSDELPVPVALGSREICLPARSLVELSNAQRRSVLAHELAHLVRRDPAWLAVFGVLRAAAWAQPLNALALRSWVEVAELCSDDWAARATGRPRTLAAALATVASWSPAAGRETPLAALVGGRSPLVLRVERLLGPSDAGGAWRGRAAVLVLACLTVLAAGAGPSVALRGAPARTARGPVAVEEVEVVRLAPRDTL